MGEQMKSWRMLSFDLGNDKRIVLPQFTVPLGIEPGGYAPAKAWFLVPIPKAPKAKP